MTESLDPNPWKRKLYAYIVDQYGKPTVMVLPPPQPSYYFWLGKDAYPEWRVVDKIIVGGIG